MPDIKIAVLPGDGIGPEIMEAALVVLAAASEKYCFSYEFEEAPVGGAAIDAVGKALPADTLKLCEDSDAILFGAVGGPKWESLPPAEQPERAALLPLRKHFDLFANLRPAVIFPALAGASPLRADKVEGGLDILVVRELTSGIYFGQPKGREENGGDARGFDTMEYCVSQIERIARVGFEAARKRRKKVTSIDKANVLATMVLWREVVTRVAKDYPDVEFNHLYVDNAAMQLIVNPKQFDVLLAGNMFGDILSDEAAIITGSLGMLPSASLAMAQGERQFGLYEPAGGSAPDIAGKGIANPIAQILSLAMLLRYSGGKKIAPADEAIEKAVERVLSDGLRTRDIASGAKGETIVNTLPMGEAIAKAL